MTNNTNAAADRYRWTPQRVDDYVRPGIQRNGMWRPPAFAARPELDLPDGQFDLYTTATKDVGRLDNVAWAFYHDPTLWWIIAWVNHITNQMVTETPLAVGDVVKAKYTTQGVVAGLAYTITSVQVLDGITTYGLDDLYLVNSRVVEEPPRGMWAGMVLKVPKKAYVDNVIEAAK